jgi:hypothetical protein
MPLMVLLGIGSTTFACEDSDGFQACLSYYTENYFRLPQVNRTLFDTATGTFFTKHADGVMRQRNELRLDLHYAPDPKKFTLGVPIEFNLRVRPYYDTAYDLTGWGQGQYRTYLADDWQTNLNGRMNDQYDPLLREYYVDVLPKNFFIRVGRQIISWGTSDGVYMLDILNPFNLSNPTNFDEQYNKIPIWALNANWTLTSTGTFQFVYEPKYLPYYYPGLPIKGGLPSEGGYHDFTYNVVAFFNNEENGEFGAKVPVDYHQPSIRPNNGIYAARWSDEVANFHYTLNYVYGWTAFMIQFPNTGNFSTATSVNATAAGAYRRRLIRLRVSGRARSAGRNCPARRDRADGRRQVLRGPGRQPGEHRSLGAIAGSGQIPSERRDRTANLCEFPVLAR